MRSIAHYIDINPARSPTQNRLVATGVGLFNAAVANRFSGRRERLDSAMLAGAFEIGHELTAVDLGNDSMADGDWRSRNLKAQAAMARHFLSDLLPAPFRLKNFCALVPMNSGSPVRPESESQPVAGQRRVVRLAVRLEPGEAELPQRPAVAGSLHARAEAQRADRPGQRPDAGPRGEAQCPEPVGLRQPRRPVAARGGADRVELQLRPPLAAAGEVQPPARGHPQPQLPAGVVLPEGGDLRPEGGALGRMRGLLDRARAQRGRRRPPQRPRIDAHARPQLRLAHAQPGAAQQGPAGGRIGERRLRLEVALRQAQPRKAAAVAPAGAQRMRRPLGGQLQRIRPRRPGRDRGAQAEAAAPAQAEADLRAGHAQPRHPGHRHGAGPHPQPVGLPGRILPGHDAALVGRRDLGRPRRAQAVFGKARVRLVAAKEGAHQHRQQAEAENASAAAGTAPAAGTARAGTAGAADEGPRQLHPGDPVPRIMVDDAGAGEALRVERDRPDLPVAARADVQALDLLLPILSLADLPAGTQPDQVQERYRVVIRVSRDQPVPRRLGLRLGQVLAQLDMHERNAVARHVREAQLPGQDAAVVAPALHLEHQLAGILDDHLAMLDVQAAGDDEMPLFQVQLAAGEEDGVGEAREAAAPLGQGLQPVDSAVEREVLAAGDVQIQRVVAIAEVDAAAQPPGAGPLRDAQHVVVAALGEQHIADQAAVGQLEHALAALELHRPVAPDHRPGDVDPGLAALRFRAELGDDAPAPAVGGIFRLLAGAGRGDLSAIDLDMDPGQFYTRVEIRCRRRIEKFPRAGAGRLRCRRRLIVFRQIDCAARPQMEGEDAVRLVALRPDVRVPGRDHDGPRAAVPAADAVRPRALRGDAAAANIDNHIARAVMQAGDGMRVRALRRDFAAASDVDIDIAFRPVIAEDRVRIVPPGHDLRVREIDIDSPAAVSILRQGTVILQHAILIHSPAVGKIHRVDALAAHAFGLHLAAGQGDVHRAFRKVVNLQAPGSFERVISGSPEIPAAIGAEAAFGFDMEILKIDVYIAVLDIFENVMPVAQSDLKPAGVMAHGPDVGPAGAPRPPRGDGDIAAAEVLRAHAMTVLAVGQDFQAGQQIDGDVADEVDVPEHAALLVGVQAVDLGVHAGPGTADRAPDPQVEVARPAVVRDADAAGDGDSVQALAPLSSQVRVVGGEGLVHHRDVGPRLQRDVAVELLVRVDEDAAVQGVRRIPLHGILGIAQDTTWPVVPPAVVVLGLAADVVLLERLRLVAAHPRDDHPFADLEPVVGIPVRNLVEDVALGGRVVVVGRAARAHDGLRALGGAEVAAFVRGMRGGGAKRQHGDCRDQRPARPGRPESMRP